MDPKVGIATFAAIGIAVVAALALPTGDGTGERGAATTAPQNEIYGYYKGAPITKAQFEAMIREGSRYADEKHLRAAMEQALERR